jgi:hypothetical protein
MHHLGVMTMAPDSTYNSTDANELYRVRQIRLAALICSSVSLVATIIVFYWFCRMDKLFRHKSVSQPFTYIFRADAAQRLIMLLVYGDLMRSIWYFVFAIYAMARGTLKTESKLCQASGFLIQYGTETSGQCSPYHTTHPSDSLSDYAVLVIAIHSALQMFRPTARGNSDGLYDYRLYVFSMGFVLPSIMAGLAFVSPGPAYESLGGFCQLPIRPFWYRLALSWIPRYIIAFVIMGLAGIIYAYVGCQFRAFANLSQNTGMQTPATTNLGLSRIDGDGETADEDHESQTADYASVRVRRASSVAQDAVSSQRKEAAVAFGPTTYVPDPVTPGIGTNVQSLPGSSTQLALNRTTPSRPGLSVIPSGYMIQLSPSILDLQGPLSPFTQSVQDPLANITPATPVTPVEDAPSDFQHSAKSPIERRLRSHRRRVHRQLRLLFVYPLAYTLMWLVPFIHHSMNYSDYWANHPLWYIRLGQAICYTSMGFVDCVIFSMREKPWRSVQSKASIDWSSLAVWRRASKSSTAETGSTSVRKDSSIHENRSRSMTESWHESRVARVKHSVRTSASDDYTKNAVDQARKRLGLEKLERLAVFKARDEARRVGEFGSNDSNTSGQQQKGKEKMVEDQANG